MNHSQTIVSCKDEAIGYALLRGWITKAEAAKRVAANFAEQRSREAVADLYLAHKGRLKRLAQSGT